MNPLLNRYPISKEEDAFSQYFSNFALRSAGDFVFAQTNNAPNLLELAGNVMCLLDGHYMTVNQIEASCSNHGWSSLTFESWEWKRRSRIFLMAAKLRSVERAALLLYAESIHTLNIRHSAVYDAIEEARRDIEGHVETILHSAELYSTSEMPNTTQNNQDQFILEHA